MKILITGAAGFIGHNVVRSLEQDGHEIFGIDNRNSYFIGFNNSRAISSTLYTEDNNQIYSCIKRVFG